MATTKQIELLEKLGVSKDVSGEWSYDKANYELQRRLNEPSAAQIKYLRDMGIETPENLTRHEAQEMIAQLVPKATVKQTLYAQRLGAHPKQIADADTKEKMDKLIRRLKAIRMMRLGRSVEISTECRGHNRQFEMLVIESKKVKEQIRRI